MINIIGGIKKRTSITVPLENVRPTSAKKREAIFSIIENYGLKNNFNIYKNAIILDLFAGSGILGLEAISRGAIFGYFYENNLDVIQHLGKNCLKVCKNNCFEINKESILKSNFKNIDKKISLVFMDPPYKINPFEQVLSKIIKSGILSKNALIILEYSYKSKINIPSFFYCLKEKKYGKTIISLLIKKII